MSDLLRIKELIKQLNDASNAYYNAIPIITDYEWDKMYDELVELEKNTGIIYPNSPTQTVGYKVLDKISEVEHNHLMLSLDKCHSEDELIKFASNKNCVLSVKADGLTISLHYIDGNLVGAETRGNGITGSNVLENVLNIKNVPHSIPYKEELIIDGEAIIDWKTFSEINNNLPKGVDKYKHPRNLVSGTITMLDTKVAASRNMRFIAWRVIKGLDGKSVFFDLKEAEKLGFEIIPMWTYSNNSTDKYNLTSMLSNLQDVADKLGIPYDGAVMSYDDVEYGMSLGRTDKFFRHSIAYKYEDELYETVLRDIEWQTSKTGLVNPVAVFDKVMIDGASIAKATLHNISYIENLQLGIGDKIRVYKANKIIPKVHDNLTRSNTYYMPNVCPVCGKNVEIHNDNGSKTLHCSNEYCTAQLLGKMIHFCSKNAVNIDGMSEATLDFLMKKGWINSFKDIFYLSKYKKQWETYSGFGKKSVEKLLDNIERSRSIKLENFLYSLSIPFIGKSATKDISKYCKGNPDIFVNEIIHNSALNFQRNIDGFGEVMYNSLTQWWNNNCTLFMDLSNEFVFIKEENSNTKSSLNGNIFVITGKLNHYSNRDELIKVIESCGGKVSGSVSSKTNYLINNDKLSQSSKNKKAQSLNVEIISEDDFLQIISN